MKRFWTIFAVALVALGVTACSEGADEQATPNFEGVSFYASVNMGADSRATLEKDDEGVWNTIWEGNETLIANINWTNKFEFSNTPEEPNKFTCTDPSILDLMVDGPVSANIYNKNAENGPNSAMGADGISIWSTCMLGSGDPVVLEADCAILRYSSDYEVTFTTAAAYLSGFFGDGTMEGYDVKSFSELTLPAGKDILVPIFYADLAGSGSLSYAIDGKTCGTISNFSPKNGTIYNLGTLDKPSKYHIYVYNSDNWGSVNLYAWDVNETYLNGAWPGAALKKTTVGEVEYYVFDIPNEYEGQNINFIINDGNGVQTADIPMTVNSDVYYYTSGEVIADPANPVLPTTYKIYAYNKAGWANLYLWCWNATSSTTNYTGGTWPGKKLTETTQINGYTYYVYEMPTSATDQQIKMLFNSGNNGSQTADSPVITLDKDVYMSVNGGTTTVIEDPNNPENVAGNERSIYVTTSLSWSKMNLYTWSPELATWPGKAITTKETINGTTYWVLKLGADYDGATFGGMIFNNGSSQTVDITTGTTLSKDLFFRIETSQTSGKYKVTAIADPRQ